jgi:hypothetical protein
MVISSEGMAELTADKWREFDVMLGSAEAHAGCSFEGIDVLYTRRDPEAQARSVYPQLLQLGSRLRADAALPTFVEHYQQFYDAIERVLQGLPRPYGVRSLSFEAESPSSAGFTERWLRWALGDEVAASIPNELRSLRSNGRISDERIEEIFSFNSYNLPLDNEESLPFHPSHGVDDELGRARERFAAFMLQNHQKHGAYEQIRFLSAENDRLRELNAELETQARELTALKETKSWRYTAWARRLKARRP